MSSYYALTQIISAICQRIGMLLDGNLVPEKCLDFGFESDEITKIIQGRSGIPIKKFQDLIDAGNLNTEQRNKCNFAFYNGKVELTEKEFDSIRKNGHLQSEISENKDAPKNSPEEVTVSEFIETAVDEVIKDNLENPDIETEEKSFEIRLGDLLKKYLRIAKIPARKLYEEAGIAWPHISHLLNNNLYGISDEKAVSLIKSISNFLNLSSEDRNIFSQALEKEIAIKKAIPKKRSGRKKKEKSSEEIPNDEINKECSLGDLFLKYIKRIGLKQKEVSEKLGFSQYHISYLKQNNFDKISKETLKSMIEKILILLNLSGEEKTIFLEIAEKEIERKDKNLSLRKEKLANKKESKREKKKTSNTDAPVVENLVKNYERKEKPASCLINVEKNPLTKAAIAELLRVVAIEKTPLASEIDGAGLFNDLRNLKAIVLLI